MARRCGSRSWVAVHRTVDEQLGDLVMSVVQSSRPTVTSDLDRHQVGQVWHDHVTIFNDFSNQVAMRKQLSGHGDETSKTY
eukprot:3883391-Amphidinium_carterae.1